MPVFIAPTRFVALRVDIKSTIRPFERHSAEALSGQSSLELAEEILVMCSVESILLVFSVLALHTPANSAEKKRKSLDRKTCYGCKQVTIATT